MRLHSVPAVSSYHSRPIIRFPSMPVTSPRLRKHHFRSGNVAWLCLMFAGVTAARADNVWLNSALGFADATPSLSGDTLSPSSPGLGSNFGLSFDKGFVMGSVNYQHIEEL